MGRLIVGCRRPLALPASRLWGWNWSDWDLSDSVGDGAWFVADIPVEEIGETIGADEDEDKEWSDMSDKEPPDMTSDGVVEGVRRDNYPTDEGVNDVHVYGQLTNAIRRFLPVAREGNDDADDIPAKELKSEGVMCVGDADLRDGDSAVAVHVAPLCEFLLLLILVQCRLCM